jgi:hypothetical protein
MRLARLVALGFVGTVTATVLACGTDPVGVEACRKIEHARCANAPGCGIDLSHPVHRGDTPELAVVACKNFYDDACLHGLSAPTDPGNVAVDACVDAINNGDCSVVKTPETTPACSFLIPPAAPAPTPDAAAPDA